MRTASKISFLCLVLSLTQALWLGARENPPRPSGLIASLGTDLGPLSFENQTPLTPAWQAYRDFYRFTVPEDVRFYAGLAESPPYRIAVQAFLVDEPKGTVFLVHGLFDHTGLIAPLINYLTARGFSVISLDLPGHGLSSGERAAIDDFFRYGEALRATVESCRPVLEGPLFAVAHSTGCAGIIEDLYAGGEPAFDRIILLAPLVRSVLWGPSRVGHWLGGDWLHRTRRWYRNATTDRQWAAFQKLDPLGCTHLPLDWSTALFAWEKRLHTYPDIQTSSLIIQGTKDTVVKDDWNVPFLSQKLGSRVEYLDGAHHLLINETATYTEPLFRYIEDFLLSD